MLLLHGITTQKNEFANFFGRVAAKLADASISSLRIDFRGHGDSQVSSRAFTVASQVLDTLTSIDWLLKTTGHTHVHLLGCSFGAPPALFAASMRAADVRTIALVCPVLDYRATFLEPRTEWASSLFNDATLAAMWRDGSLQMADGFLVDAKLVVEMHLLNPAETLARITTPSLIVHGEADSMVPYELSAQHARGLRHVRLLGIPRMDHGFTDADDDTGESEASRRNLDRIVDEILNSVGQHE